MGGWRRLSASAVLRACALLLACATAGSSLVDSQPPRPSEYDVKAAYLLNFGKFMRVPGNAAPRGHFDICVVGSDPMGQELDSLAAGEQIDGVPVRIRRVREASEARSCDIAYLGTTDTARMDADLAALRDADVLTVGDAPNFLEHGGMIQFVVVAQHVRFSVNLNAVHRTHLALSSELLRVALSVTGRNGEVQP
jgi:hypothetical protein